MSVMLRRERVAELRTLGPLAGVLEAGPAALRLQAQERPFHIPRRYLPAARELP
jgi:hypothetical protein